jgi:hypothetical protein
MLHFQAIRKFCASREVDVVLALATPPFVLCLQGQFNGSGDFFRLLAKDVEYIELAGGFTVGDLAMTTDVSALSSLSPKWSQLSGLYSGPAVALRSADSGEWGSDRGTFVVVANHLEWHAGRDWRAAGGVG